MKEDWDDSMKYKMEDLFLFIRNGANIKQGKKGGFPITRIETISGRVVDREKMGYADIYDVEKYESYVLQNEDILMSHINSVKHLGKSALFTREFPEEVVIHGMNLLCLRANKDLILPKYAFYFFNSTLFTKLLMRYVKPSVNQASFAIRDFKKLEINIPSLSIQKKVVDVLERLNKTLNLRKEQIEALSALKQSVFLDMFGDPYRNKNSFDILKLSDIKLDISNGLHLKRDEYDEDGNTAVIWISDFINKGKVDFEDIKKANVDYKRYERYKVSYGDVFFVRSSLTPEGIGKCGFIPNTNADKVIFEDHIIKVRLNNTILPEYFQAFSETTFFRNQIIKQSNTSTMTTINQNSLLDCKVMVAPIKEQQEFIEKVNQIEKNITELTESLSHFEVLYESLLHKAFNGELFKEEIEA